VRPCRSSSSTVGAPRSARTDGARIESGRATGTGDADPDGEADPDDARPDDDAAAAGVPRDQDRPAAAASIAWFASASARVFSARGIQV